MVPVVIGTIVVPYQLGEIQSFPEFAVQKKHEENTTV